MFFCSYKLANKNAIIDQYFYLKIVKNNKNSKISNLFQF